MALCGLDVISAVSASAACIGNIGPGFGSVGPVDNYAQIPVVGKWLLTNPKLVIFDEPTRGIDVGAKAEIYQRIRDLTHDGVGVIMASSELPELIGMSDRVLVFHEGRIAGEVERADFSEEAIMRLATATEEMSDAVQ